MHIYQHCNRDLIVLCNALQRLCDASAAQSRTKPWLLDRAPIQINVGFHGQRQRLLKFVERSEHGQVDRYIAGLQS